MNLKKLIFDMGMLIFLSGAILAFSLVFIIVLSKEHGFINQGLIGVILSFIIGHFADKKWSIIKNNL